MVRVVAACVCAAILGGCASGYVGSRGGAVVALGGAQESGPITSSADHVGGIYGMSFGGRFSDNVGLQTDVNVRSVGRTQGVLAYFAQRGETFQFDGTIESTAQVVEMPLLLVLSRRIEGPIQPFIGVGGNLGTRFSRSTTVAGTLTLLSGPGAGTSLRTTETRSSSYFSENVLVGFAALVGADYMLTQDWSLRGEVRFNHDFTNDLLSAQQFGYSFLGPSADVRSQLPATRLTLAVSLLFAL